MFQKSIVLSFLFILVAPLTALAQTAPALPDETTTVATSTVTSVVSTTFATTTPAINPHNSADVEAAVRSYFADIPIMAAIAKCESDFRQFNGAGTVLNGGSGGMIGVFQINKSVHASTALALGDDIATLTGNLAYARYLYADEGTTPWDSSKSCWGSAVSALSDTVAVATTTLAAATSTTIAQAPALSAVLSVNLKMGIANPQVAQLQQLLNAAGYTVAKSGAGSPGNESQLFGSLTRAAVQRFQCASNIVCSGSEATTGYGLVGAKTRTALSGLAANI